VLPSFFRQFDGLGSLIVEYVIEDIKKVLELKQYINPQPLVPKEYYNLINKFKKQFIGQLAPH